MAPLSLAAQLGRELRRLRLQGGMSQRRLVRALGLSAHSNLVQYELGRRIPPGDIIVACERIFGEAARSLRQLHAEALAEHAAIPRPPHAEALTVPAMLPAAVADFTGRVAQLRWLREVTEGAPPAAVVITAIVGTAGVGKTALAVHFGHQVRNRFPDGQLYLNLRGFGPGRPVLPGQALEALLYALGVPADAVPTDVDQAVGLYRSVLSGRRVLVVLDNAHRADQVRPLLPGAPGCQVLVTSRDRLGGLIAHDGARRLTLDVLTADEAGELLARIVGHHRVAAEPHAAAELAEVCARLPLAVRIAAANLLDQPRRPIAAYTEQLRAVDPLTALAVDGDEQGVVRAAFESSYTRLSLDAQRMFRRLGLLPGLDVTASAAAELAGVDRGGAAKLLDELAAAHLVDEPVPGRFACHDLLRRYAAARLDTDDTPAEREAAAGRLYDWYVRQVDGAAELLYPGLVRLPESLSEPPDPDVSLAWLDNERANLVAAIVHAARHGPRRMAWLLADAMRGYFCLRLYSADWLSVARAALTAAHLDAQPRAAAAAHLSLANLYLYQSNYDQAGDHGREALTLARRSGWRQGEAAILDNLGTVCWQAGLLEQAAGYYARALEINRQIGWRLGQANNLSNLGLVHRDSGQLASAVDHFTAALELDRQAETHNGEAVTLSNLGETYHAQGRLDQAHDQLTRAVALCRELGDRGGEANALHRLAAVDLDAGRDAAALTQAVDAVALAVEIDDPRVHADALIVLATVEHRRGWHAEAAEHLDRARQLAKESENRVPEATAMIGLAAVLHEASYAEQARELAAAAGYRLLEAQALATLADLGTDETPG